MPHRGQIRADASRRTHACGRIRRRRLAAGFELVRRSKLLDLERISGDVLGHRATTLDLGQTARAATFELRMRSATWIASAISTREGPTINLSRESASLP